jgi:hypothetical protein
VVVLAVSVLSLDSSPFWFRCRPPPHHRSAFGRAAVRFLADSRCSKHPPVGVAGWKGRLAMRRLAVPALVAMFLTMVSPSRADADPRVRPIDRQSGIYLQHGARYSVTFHALLDLIDASDVLVYVETPLTTSFKPSARTNFVAHTGLLRVLKVTLEVGTDRQTAVRLLGHELQHVAEVVGAPAVVDASSYGRLFRAIGFRSSCPGLLRVCFETPAAERAGAQVLRDLVRPEPRADAIVARAP